MIWSQKNSCTSLLRNIISDSCQAPCDVIDWMGSNGSLVVIRRCTSWTCPDQSVKNLNTWEIVALARIRGLFLQAISVTCIGCGYLHASRGPLCVGILLNVLLMGALYFSLTNTFDFRTWTQNCRPSSKLLFIFCNARLVLFKQYGRLRLAIQVARGFWLCAVQVILSRAVIMTLFSHASQQGMYVKTAEPSMSCSVWSSTKLCVCVIGSS